MTEQCVKCDTELTAGSQFCHRCGAPTVAVKTRTPAIPATAQARLYEDSEHAGVRLGDLVDLGEGEGEAQVHRIEVLSHRPPLVAEVPTGLLDERKKPLVLATIRPRHESRGV